jgi:hypothetical protein
MGRGIPLHVYDDYNKGYLKELFGHRCHVVISVSIAATN